MVETLTQPAPQATWEPCDRCGAGAAARITLPSGGMLHLCGHHLRNHSSRLAEMSAQVRLAPHHEHLGTAR